MATESTGKQHKYDLFISYSSVDKDWASKLAAAIEGNKDGAPLHVYFAEWDLPPGGIIPQELENALDDSRHIGLILSPESLASGWVSLERAAAICRDPAAHSQTLIPLLRRDCAVPSLLSTLKYIDFRRSEDFEGSCHLLVAALRGIPLRSGTALTEEQISTMSDVDALRKQIVVFVRDAFTSPCILEQSIPDLCDAIDDTKAALNTGTLNSRRGALVQHVPNSRAYKTAVFRTAMRQIGIELTDLKTMTVGLVTTLRSIDETFPQSDFGHIMSTLTLKYRYGYGESYYDAMVKEGLREGSVGEVLPALMKDERINREIGRINLLRDELEALLKSVLATMDAIDAKKNNILGILNELLEISNDEKIDSVELSSKVLRDHYCGLASQLREQLGELGLSRLGVIDVRSPPSSTTPRSEQNEKRAIECVFITEGCISCGACQAICPEVFSVSVENSDTAIVRTDAAAHYETHRAQVEAAALACCVSVIKVQYAEGKS